MPDVSETPLHALPYSELMTRLKAMTNFRVVEDENSPTGYTTQIGPFPGWDNIPQR